MKKYRLTEDSRLHDYQSGGENQQVRLWQIEALRDFADVRAGQSGGWVESEGNLSQVGDCWLEEDAKIWGGASVEDNALVTGESDICQGARISDNARIEHSQISGECHIFNHARVQNRSQIIAVLGLTEDPELRLQIYGHATLSASRVVHQAQIYGHARVNNAFIEHRAEVYDLAIIEGNEENNVWICDCAKVFGSARIVAGFGDSQIPTVRYSSKVYDNAVIEGDCVLKHRVRVFGDATLTGGPIQLDDNVQIYGEARLTGNVLIENNVQIYDRATVEGCGDELIHIRGIKDINGEQLITRSPFYGVF
ncbi:YdcK family protein [Cedecea davisae]|uniref:YdcK family protein n=1 Tax=Cedecea davisae TaxID=158484 RepID=UPI001D0BD586|nr:YdcK family protein [Cedecea davisae]